ncbi:MAG: molybdate ABC transporter substrate-binding protein [Xanthobacteraceae bacterium]
MAKLKVMCARSMHEVVGWLAADYGRSAGHEMGVSFGTVGALQKRLDAGETADVVVIATPAMDKLAQAGAVDPASRTDIAITSVGIAVRTGAPAPDVSTPEAFRQALVNARKVAFSDAAVGGSAGVYLAKLFVDMGIADEIARKAMPQQSGGEVATRVANGEADIGMTLIAEIVPVQGTRVLGSLPAPLGNDTTYCAAVMRASAAPDAAAGFIAALRQPEERSRWEAAGFTLP